ncbi:Peptidoglycan-binding lysin domain protein [Solidesulfovibrio fructosivorans JJ]]|uniref:Peptidoglycan-binding lysin domain protein n=1 Tax=Solidesulfovibrio fructosivorans JJ] TaxID=596151 RepID=E1JSB6_SOLFR|nr:LysM peptidoglycan-binding domain-containing protein [Solidesulfovibrio fructosivorans]EFL52885.1 Peptidoglycan-binding lysin domain protein [Solidesulfovibrio fructosivorans JJ]]
MRYGRALTVAILLGLVVSGCSKEDPQAFSKVDYNKDGKIIFEELIVAFPDMTVEEFLAADADRNGTLDEKEYQRLREARASGKKLDASSASAKPAAQPAKPAAEQKPAEAAKPADAAKPAEQPKAETTPAPAAPAAAAPEPAKPAEQQKVEAAAPAAPAQAPAPAKESATPAPAAPAAETVTVEVQSTPDMTYTVGRGDTLTRIAKKFDVSVKALMEANDLKNADHLEAGATLTIPSANGGQAAAQPVPPAVADIVTGYFTKSASGDINGLIDYYADKVEYYKKGKSGKDIVRQDKAAYFARWPERTYEPGKASVRKLKNGDLRVTVPSGFAVKKGDKSVRGKAVFTFLLHPSGDTYRIVGEQSRVTEKK